MTTFSAMKCDPAPEVLTRLAAGGASFEIASTGELRTLRRLGVDPAGVLYSNPVKPPAHIAEAHRTGLWRFSFDSPDDLAGIAEYAPGAAVYVRLRVDDSTSTFPLSRTFGADPADAYDVLLLARRLGLRPYGVTFDVGSQCTDPGAWRDAIGVAGRLMGPADDASRPTPPPGAPRVVPEPRARRALDDRPSTPPPAQTPVHKGYRRRARSQKALPEALPGIDRHETGSSQWRTKERFLTSP